MFFFERFCKYLLLIGMVGSYDRRKVLRKEVLGFTIQPMYRLFCKFNLRNLYFSLQQKQCFDNYIKTFVKLQHFLRGMLRAPEVERRKTFIDQIFRENVGLQSFILRMLNNLLTGINPIVYSCQKIILGTGECANFGKMHTHKRTRACAIRILAKRTCASDVRVAENRVYTHKYHLRHYKARFSKMSKSYKTFFAQLRTPEGKPRGQKLKNWCELDVRVIACNFKVFVIFSFFLIFSDQTCLFFNQKQKKYIWVFFPLILCH